MPPDARARLLDRQRALLRSVLEGAAPPQGLDAERLKRVAATLHDKRVRSQCNAVRPVQRGRDSALHRWWRRVFGRGG
jgi:hypothetical protein